jgi:predicted transcriptional regulator
MAVESKPIKLTVTLDDRDLYRALRHAAVERDSSLRDIVNEALRQWLERYESQLDLAAIRETEGEETVPWEQVREQTREARRRAGE